MATNLTFTHQLDDLPDTTKITTVIMQDKTGTFGARDLLTGTVIVPVGTPVAEISAGIFSLDLETFVEYVPSMDVQFSMLVTQDDGDTFYVNGTVEAFQPTGPLTSMDDWRLNVAELISRVGLACEDPLHERYLVTDIIEEINNVTADLAVETHFITETIILQTFEAQEVYDIKTLAEALGVRDYVMTWRLLVDDDLQRTPLPTSQNVLDLRRHVDFQGRVSKWHVDTVDWGQFKIWGTPTEDGSVPPETTNNLTASFYAMPIKVAGLADEIDPKIPATASEAIIFGVAANLYTCEEDKTLIDKGLEYNVRYEDEKRKLLRDYSYGKPLDDVRPI